MPQDTRRKSCDDYDAIDPEFPPPSLKSSQNDGGRESERRKKKDKKWSIGGLFRRKKKVSDTDSSSPIDDEEEKKGFLERRRAARKRRNRGSKDVTGSFEHVIIKSSSRQNLETTSIDRPGIKEVLSERLVGSEDSLPKRQTQTRADRGSSVSLEGVGRRGGRIQVKARVEANRERLKVNSSSDEEGGGSSRHSSSSIQRLKGDENLGSKDGSLSRRSRTARTERYKKRLSRDDESLRDFHVIPTSRISRSDDKLANKRAEKTQTENRWTAKVVYCESSDYDTKYTAKTKSATPSPIQSPKAKHKNVLHYTASAPSGSSYVTYPPSHAREGVAGSHQELRSHHYVHKANQRYAEVTPPRLPKSNSDLISKGSGQNATQKHYSPFGQDALNRKSASYDCNVNSLHYVNSQISQPHPMDENVLVVQFPISRPAQKIDSKGTKLGNTPPYRAKQSTPPPPPPRRFVPSNSYQHEISPRPMSYAFEDRNDNQTRYSGLPEFGSTISAFQRVPQTILSDCQPINKHHRSSSDHEIPSRISVKNSPPLSRRPPSVQSELITRLYPINSENFVSSPPSDSQQTGVPYHYQYYTDQQPRSRKPIHITYQNQKSTNDSYLSDSQVVVKPPIQQTPRTRPLGVQNASEFWKQKDQETVKKVHLSEGSPKLIQKHFLNINTSEKSRSTSPHYENNLVTSRLKLPPLIMPVRSAESSGSLSSQSSPRDIPSPRTPSGRKLVHNEIGIPVFDGLYVNSPNKREYRPLSMLEEKQETSEQEISPVREKSNNPPIPPTRRDSKVNAVTNFEHFDTFSDDNELKEGRRNSSNLEEALNELEAIYKSLRLGEEGYIEKVAKEQALYENNRLDPSNWNAWVQSRGFESDSSFNYSRSSLESVDSIDSPVRRASRIRRSGVPDRVTDDMAYRRLNKKDRPPPPHEQEVISQAGSFLLVSPTLSPPPFIEPPPVTPVKNEPDITLDDVVYRNIKHVNNALKVLDPQPPFGIPLGPITPAPTSDYLHATPKETYRPTFKPRKTPDIVTDDLAFRNLRKDNNKEPLFTLEDTTLIDSPTLRKKRAVRSLSANLLSIIQKESMTLNNNNKLMYNNNNVHNDLEKSQSFTDVTDALNVNDAVLKGQFLEQRNLSDIKSKKNLSSGDSDITPRVSRTLSVGSSSPLIATSTETLTGSKSSLWTVDSKTANQKLSQNSSPRLSLTPERRHTTENIQLQIQNSVSPAKYDVTGRSESFKINNLAKPKSMVDFQRSPTPDSHTYTHQTDKREIQSPLAYNKTESDLLAILAREATEASEQLSKELNELNLGSKDQVINDYSSKTTISQPDDKETNAIRETPSPQTHTKTLPIGKIISHKPVKLNTFYITEDNKLENKQTLVTNKPVEIEGSKSMTDLLKELTKSLDFDFGGAEKDSEKQSLSSTENMIESSLQVKCDQTIESDIFSEAKEQRTTDRKECFEEHYFSSLEEMPDQNQSSPDNSLLCSLPETIPSLGEQRTISPVQNVSPVNNSFPLDIADENVNKESKLLVPEIQTSPDLQPVIPSDEVPSRQAVDDRRPSASGAGGCSKDCSSLADEGTKSVSRCVSDPSTLLLVCMACHQLAGLDVLTVLGLLLAMASLILFLIL